MDGVSMSTCWCGSLSAQPSTSRAYVVCETCGTCRLADAHGWSPQVAAGGAGIYGERYWHEHMTQDLGYPCIEQRAVLDLTERCLHWLTAVLRYTAPSGNALEIGCAHGGFVKILNLAGFNAIGLEMDEAIIAYAQDTFGVTVVKGPLEVIPSPPRDLRLCCMFDVIEHLPNPQTTLKCLGDCMQEDGVIVLQTPDYGFGGSDQWSGFKVPEHLYLFTRKSIQHLLEDAGFNHIRFEEPCFVTDMFVVASRVPLRERSEAELREALLASPDGRIVYALLWLGKAARDAGRAAWQLRAENTILRNMRLSSRLRRLLRGQVHPIAFVRRALNLEH